jgi:hypothetical protein
MFPKKYETLINMAWRHIPQDGNPHFLLFSVIFKVIYRAFHNALCEYKHL